MATKANRPGIVTLLGILGLISGIAKAFSGLMIALARDKTDFINTTGLTNNGVVWAGLVLMALGAITIFIAASILSGERWAQIWYGVIVALNMVGGLWSIFADDGVSRWSGLATIVFSLIILQLLFNERAQAYFEK